MTLTLHHTKAKNKSSIRLKFLPIRKKKTPLFCSAAISPFFWLLRPERTCPNPPAGTWLRYKTCLLGPVRLRRGACLLQADVKQNNISDLLGSQSEHSILGKTCCEGIYNHRRYLWRFDHRPALLRGNDDPKFSSVCSKRCSSSFSQIFRAM